MKVLSRAICTLVLLSTQIVYAGIQISSTRVIYPATKREVTLSITNNASTPRLLQTWIDAGDPDVSPDVARVPFIITPPIFRIDPHKGQTLRIVFTGDNIPQDRESVFWINILEIKPKPTEKKKAPENYMQFSVRSRLKLFYRPEGLAGSPKEAVDQLRWRLVAGSHGHVLECDNPSPYNVSFNNISFNSASSNAQAKQTGMCPAKSQRAFSIQATPTSLASGKLFLTTIDDYGGYHDYVTNYSH